MVKYVSSYYGYTVKKDQKKTYLMMIIRFFFIFLYKGICCGYSFELHGQVDAIQISTNNICLYKEVDKKYTCCILKITELLDCALIGICAIIRSNTVFLHLLATATLPTDPDKGSIVFDLITAHTPISAQSRNSVVFRLQPVYFFFTSL